MPSSCVAVVSSVLLLLLLLIPLFLPRRQGISMYTEAPFEEITLDEFELVALDRLQVLRKIEDLKVQRTENAADAWRGGGGGGVAATWNAFCGTRNYANASHVPVVLSFLLLFVVVAVVEFVFTLLKSKIHPDLSTRYPHLSVLIQNEFRHGRFPLVTG